MDEPEADSHTRVDVDILILDYLLCITIDKIIHAQALEREDFDICWLNKTLKSFMTILPAPTFLASDIQTKLQLLDFANDYNSHKNQLIPTSWDLETEGSGRTKTNTTTKIAEQKETNLQPNVAAARLLSICDAVRGNIVFQNHMARLAADVSLEPRMRHEVAEFVRCLLPPPGISDDARMVVIDAKLSIPQLRPVILTTLANIMGALDPPILIQVERGKIEGLSRKETRQLRDRVGLK